MLIVTCEKYIDDLHFEFFEKNFPSLKDLEDWIFSQIHQNYADKENGIHVLSFPTPQVVEKLKTGPWRISFRPDRDGAEYSIHLIKKDRGIIFSDGKLTANQRHWSKEVQQWLEQMHEWQYAPTFNFVD